MPISQFAIDAFLRKPVPYIPNFKLADPEWLMATIFDLTGKPYKPRTQPRPHQLEGLAFALYQSRALLYYSMRLGKSLMSLQFAEQLRVSGKWRGKGIIICHAPIALDVWESEAEKHSNLFIYPVRNQLDEFIAGLESDADLLVVPWSGLQNIFSEMRISRKGKNKRYPDYEAVRIAAEGLSLAIIDEIHGAKNHTSLRFLIARELIKHCNYRLGLTGTPFGRNPFDVWTQAYLIDGGKTLGFNYNFFEAAFGLKKKNYFSGLPEYVFDKKKQPLLEEKLASISLPYKLEECQQVPVYPGSVELNITGDQYVAYQEAIDKIVKLNTGEKAEIQAVFIRLRQISSGFLPFIDAHGNKLLHRFKNNAKLEWLREFLPESDVSLVIIHEFTETGQMICNLLKELKIKHNWLHGATKDKPATVREFQAKAVQCIVVQSATGSLAIDLHVADYMLFYESPVSPLIRAQAEARPLSQARGTRPLLMDDLTCSNIERKIREYVEEGRDLMSAIVHERNSLKEKPKDGKRGKTRAV